MTNYLHSRKEIADFIKDVLGDVSGYKIRQFVLAIKEPKEKCDLCEREIEHVGTNCWNYAGHTSRPSRPKIEPLDTTTLDGQWAFRGDVRTIVETLNKVINLLNK